MRIILGEIIEYLLPRDPSIAATDPRWEVHVLGDDGNFTELPFFRPITAVQKKSFFVCQPDMGVYKDCIVYSLRPEALAAMASGNSSAMLMDIEAGYLEKCYSATVINIGGNQLMGPILGQLIVLFRNVTRSFVNIIQWNLSSGRRIRDQKFPRFAMPDYPEFQALFEALLEITSTNEKAVTDLHFSRVFLEKTQLVLDFDGHGHFLKLILKNNIGFVQLGPGNGLNLGRDVCRAIVENLLTRSLEQSEFEEFSRFFETMSGGDRGQVALNISDAMMSKELAEVFLASYSEEVAKAEFDPCKRFLLSSHDNKYLSKNNASILQAFVEGNKYEQALQYSETIPDEKEKAAFKEAIKYKFRNSSSMFLANGETSKAQAAFARAQPYTVCVGLIERETLCALVPYHGPMRSFPSFGPPVYSGGVVFNELVTAAPVELPDQPTIYAAKLEGGGYVSGRATVSPKVNNTSITFTIGDRTYTVTVDIASTKLKDAELISREKRLIETIIGNTSAAAVRNLTKYVVLTDSVVHYVNPDAPKI
jgi:hypothetical protein